MSSISGLTRVKDAYEEGCCIDEGNVPEEDEVCCMSGERRPLDYGNAESGRCGCPDGFGWVVLPGQEGECKPIFARCGWDEINEVNKCTSLVYIITHPIECLFDKPNKEGLPYEQVCCPYTEYDGEVYYSSQDVVVY